MVKQEEWSIDRKAPINLVDNEGKVLREVTIPFEEDDLPRVRNPPKPLHDLLHDGDTSTSKPEATGKTGTMQWVGTTKDNR